MRPDPNELLVRFDGDDAWHRYPRDKRRPGKLPATLCGRYQGKPPAVAQLRRDTEEEVCPPCEDGRRRRRRSLRDTPDVDEVSNETLREAFLKSGLSFAELARRLGVDSSRPARSLGLRAIRPDGHKQRWMHVETAARYARALGLDPHEVGI